MEVDEKYGSEIWDIYSILLDTKQNGANLTRALGYIHK